MPKTTKTEYIRFKAECLRVQEKLGLYDWTIQFHLTKLKDCNNAEITTEPERCLAIIDLNSNGITKTPEELARHEMGHLLVTRLRTMALTRFVSEEAIETEDERLANIIARLL